MPIFERNVELRGLDCNEVAKSQTLRIVDVLALGPFMIWQGSRRPNDIASFALIVAGILTIVYNFSNFVETERRNV